MPKKINIKKRNVKKKIVRRKKYVGLAQWGRKALREFKKRKPATFNMIRRSEEVYGDPFQDAEIKRNTRFSEKLHAMPQQVIVPKCGINTRSELGAAPAHYSKGKYTPWEVIDDWKLDYYTGNALKYVCRHLHKGKPVEDIQKAIDCLIKYKQNIEKETK